MEFVVLEIGGDLDFLFEPTGFVRPVASTSIAPAAANLAAQKVASRPGSEVGHQS